MARSAEFIPLQLPPRRACPIRCALSFRTVKRNKFRAPQPNSLLTNVILKLQPLACSLEPLAFARMESQPAPRHRVSVMPNGLTVATAAMPQMTSVSVGLWMGVGSRYEPARLNGVCHFIEHLLFKGTGKRSPLQISQAVEGVGGSLNAFTNEETTCVHARARHERLEELVDVLLDMLLRSRFTPSQSAKERNVIVQEIAQCRDEPEHYVEELLMTV